jgi:CBS domain-containing protein
MDTPFASFRIDSLMRRHFIVVEPEDTVEDVLRLMALARVRILPVVRHGVLVGIVGYQTLALSLLQNEPGNAVADPDARRLCESGHGCIPVVEADETGLRIVGLVTESDLLEAAYRAGRPPAPAPLSRPS